MKPLFMLSLPRSGSTLLQRVLSLDTNITTAAEPWFLLPLLCGRHENTMLAHYNQAKACKATNSFIEQAPNGEGAYDEAIRQYASHLYADYCTKGERYFLDKTPRYHLIADSLLRSFSEEAKFIVLWRQPLAVAASIVETFASGRWNLLRWEIDLYDGIINLTNVAQKYRDQIHFVSYEDLIVGDESVWEGLFAYLDLDFNPQLLDGIKNVTIEGMGDPTGQKQYTSISQEPLLKWKQSFNNPMRIRWGKDFLNWITPDRLKLMGYDSDQLMCDLKSCPSSLKSIPSDVVYSMRDILWRRINPDVFRIKRLRRKRGQNNYVWS